LLANTVSALPYAVAKYRSPPLRQAIERAARERGVDVVVCDFLAPSQNVPDGLPCRTVLFQHNVEAAIWRRHADVRTNPLARAYFREQWRRMRRFEGSECRRFGRVVAVSHADAEMLEREYGLVGVADVPTGVDIDYFRPGPGATREPHDIVFTGSMDWMPNEDGIAWFTSAVLPRIHDVMPDATLTVVGRNPPAAIQELARRDQRVRVTGTVPDVRPFMDRASAFVVPLRVGGGTRLKIYEAMAMECPLVSTTIGAEGLPVEHGRHLLIADDPGSFANAVLDLLSNKSLAHTMGSTAARWVREHYSWDRAAAEFERLLS
jgi:glycosyltransferase involved in cell wall biosynthesis